MKEIYSILLIILILSYGCSNSEDGVIIPVGENNLIKNSSFESNNSPTLDGWDITSRDTADTASIIFSTDVPINGGKFSASLRNIWTTPGEIVYEIEPTPGEHHYLFSVWGKIISDGYSLGGSASILLKHEGKVTLSKSLFFSDSVWVPLAINDTLTTVSSDTIIISLRGNISQWAGGYTLFDNCSLEKLN